MRDIDIFKTEIFIGKSELTLGTIYDYSETFFRFYPEKVSFKCRLHGSFKILARDHFEKSIGCPSCKGVGKFNTEIKLKNWLKNKYNVKPQATFEWCINKKDSGSISLLKI